MVNRWNLVHGVSMYELELEREDYVFSLHRQAKEAPCAYVFSFSDTVPERDVEVSWSEPLDSDGEINIDYLTDLFDGLSMQENFGKPLASTVYTVGSPRLSEEGPLEYLKFLYRSSNLLLAPGLPEEWEESIGAFKFLIDSRLDELR